ncbi:MAG: PAS domain S-box protein [Desulfomonile sp.]|nr:PAS domain S-box protein [Desulfomonile sp.]
MVASSQKERRQVERQLRFLAGLVEHIAVGIAFVDREGCLAYVNRAFARLHGYEPEELAGQRLVTLYPADIVMSAALADLETENSGEFTTDLVHVRKDEFSFSVSRSSTLVRDEDGTPIGMVITIWDISERKLTESLASESYQKRVLQLEGSLRETSDQLEEAHAEVKTLARRLKYTDQALKLMISQMEEFKKDTEKTMFRNITEVVLPALDQLNTLRLPESARHLLNSLAFNLKSLFLDSGRGGERELTVLTPREIRLCELIGAGLTSKEIADTTGISPGTVSAHRFNIRKKLGLVGSRRPLASHLMQKFLEP